MNSHLPDDVGKVWSAKGTSGSAGLRTGPDMRVSKETPTASQIDFASRSSLLFFTAQGAMEDKSPPAPFAKSVDIFIV